MPTTIPPVLANLPRPVTLDDMLAFGRLVTVVDSDGPHTTAPGDLVSLMRKAGNPIYQTNGGFTGRVTEAAIENWSRTLLPDGTPNLIANLPQPIRAEDANRAIIGQCSFAGCWAPDTEIANSQIRPDSERTDHPIFWVSPLGKDAGAGLNVPTQAASPYGQLAVKGSSGTPWAYIQLICYGMVAMDQTILVRWKAAAMLWANVQRLVLPVIGQPDALNWWNPLAKDQLAALMPRVCLACNMYADDGQALTPFELWWAVNAAEFAAVPMDIAREIFEAGQGAK